MRSSAIYSVLFALLISCQPKVNAEPKPPNVVVIYIDDMGYADIGPFGGNPALTPHLNQMAAEGRKFTNFYVSQAVCSASRASLLTGCYNVRLGILGALGPNSNQGIHPDEMTLGELCQQKGYTSFSRSRMALTNTSDCLTAMTCGHFILKFATCRWRSVSGIGRTCH